MTTIFTALLIIISIIGIFMCIQKRAVLWGLSFGALFVSTVMLALEEVTNAPDESHDTITIIVINRSN